MLNASRCRSAKQIEEATKVLQDNPIRPQSYDVRSLKPRGQTYAVTALAPETVNLGESERAGATTDDNIGEKEFEVEDEARVPRTKKAPVGMTVGVASPSPHSSAVQRGMPMLCCG